MQVEQPKLRVETNMHDTENGCELPSRDKAPDVCVVCVGKLANSRLKIFDFYLGSFGTQYVMTQTAQIGVCLEEEVECPGILCRMVSSDCREDPLFSEVIAFVYPARIISEIHQNTTSEPSRNPLERQKA